MPPSRAMLHTGRELFRVTDDLRVATTDHRHGGDGDAVSTLGSLLQQAGYHTHGIGKWHNDTPGFERSFTTGERVFLGGMNSHFHSPLHRIENGALTHDCGMSGHSTDVFTAAGERFLASRDPDDDQPFFLYIAYQAPHDPRLTHYRWHRQFQVEDLPLPPSFASQHDPLLPGWNGRDEMLAEYPRGEDEIRWHHANYLAITAHLDEGIGRLHRLLHEQGFDDDTLVVHTADHGLTCGRHGLTGKQNLYDESVRVPLMMAGPGVEAGCDDDRLCYQQDLFPTLLGAAGVEAPTDFERLDDVSSARDAVSFAFEYWARGIRKNRYKLVDMRLPDQRVLQLFDLEQDPYELNNLAEVSEHAARRETLQAELAQARRAVGDPLFAPGGKWAS